LKHQTEDFMKRKRPSELSLSEFDDNLKRSYTDAILLNKLIFILQREIPHQTSDAFLLMYSLEDRRTMCSIAQIVRRIRNKYKCNSPIFLVANKTDLVSHDSVAKGGETLHILSIIKFFCSTKTT
jgi:hypothetical protein